MRPYLVLVRACLLSRCRTARTSFLVGKAMAWFRQIWMQKSHPGRQLSGKATMGLAVFRSQAKTSWGQKLRQSKSEAQTP
jgi:hypothetical protein